MKVLTCVHHWWWNCQIYSLDFEKLQEYLRAYIWHDRKISLPWAIWKLQLEQLRSCYLSPTQKVQVIRQSICHVNLSSLVSRDWLYHCHGAILADLLVIIMTSRKKASQKMKTSPHIISKTTGNQIDLIYGQWLKKNKNCWNINQNKYTITMRRMAMQTKLQTLYFDNF